MSGDTVSQDVYLILCLVSLATHASNHLTTRPQGPARVGLGAQLLKATVDESVSNDPVNAEQASGFLFISFSCSYQL